MADVNSIANTILIMELLNLLSCSLNFAPSRLVVTTTLLLLLLSAGALGAQEACGNMGTPSPGAGAGGDAVKLLLMLPLSEGAANASSSAWDQGREILPAACLAVQQINQHPQLLQDTPLQLMTADIDHCVVTEFTSNIRALTTLVDIFSSPQSDVLGIVGGPFCPPLLARLVSPLASRNKSRLFQMFGSTEESVRTNDKTMHFITPSIKLYYNVVYAMMGVFNWSSLYVIADSFFKDLVTRDGLNITFRQYDASSSLIPDLRRSEKNIVFASLSPEHAADILCQAHAGSLLYPHYVWIFHDLTPDSILTSSRGGCDRETLRSTLNGAFFLKFPFTPDSHDTTLVSGITYEEYVSSTEASNPYANIVYDAVWAASLALNLSLNGEPFSHFNRERRNILIDNMDEKLPEISFQGASGRIDFSKEEMFVNDIVDIYFYDAGTLGIIGQYNTSVELFINHSLVDVPRDALSNKYVLIPGFITGILTASVILCVVLTTLVLVLFIHYRDQSDIKASSIQLSYLMFLGCYLMFAATLVHTIRGSVAITGAGVVVVCGVVVTGDSLGVNLVFATLLLRMLRVYHIFSHFGKTGKLWSNRNMACLVGVILLGDVILITVWSTVDTYRIVDVVTFRANSNPPHYEIQQFCQSDHLRLWLGLLLGKLGVLFVIVLFLAVKTRKIRKSNFKDTKKVNIYIFSTIAIVIVFMTLFFLFVAMENSLAAHLMVYFAFGVTALLCQLFLFVPKVTSPLLKKYGYEVSYGDSPNTRGRRPSLRPTLRKQDQSHKSVIALLAGGTQFAQL